MELCRCREDRDIERAQKRQDVIDAAAIDEFVAQPERVHHASNLDRGARSIAVIRALGAGSRMYSSSRPVPQPTSRILMGRSVRRILVTVARCSAAQSSANLAS